jgi:hypothetical protein
MVELETKHFPLVLLDLGGEGRTPDDLRGVFAGFRDVNGRAAAERRRWALIAVTDTPPNAVERKVISDESNAFSPAEHALTVAAVLVIPNSIIRTMITALGWMIPKMAPLASAPTTSAAVDLAVDRLRAVGLDCTAGDVDQAKRWFLRNESAPKLRSVAGGARGER